MNVSNLHRQLLYMNEDCGKEKVQAAKNAIVESIQMSMLMYIQNLFQE